MVHPAFSKFRVSLSGKANKKMNFRTATIKKTNLDVAIQKRNRDQPMKILLLSHMLTGTTTFEES